MRNVRELAQGDFMVTCQHEHGRWVMRICISKAGPRLSRQQLNLLLLGLDAANVCPKGEDAEKVLRMKGRTRFVLAEVPLRADIKPRVAMEAAERSIAICLAKPGDLRTPHTRGSSSFDAHTVRVATQTRPSRTVGVAA